MARRSALWSRKRDWGVLGLQTETATYAPKPVKALWIRGDGAG